LRDGRQCELELGTAWPTQAQTTEPKDPLEMGKQHLNTRYSVGIRNKADVIPTGQKVRAEPTCRECPI
jgi:hypothetical protein